LGAAPIGKDGSMVLMKNSNIFPAGQTSGKNNQAQNIFLFGTNKNEPKSPRDTGDISGLNFRPATADFGGETLGITTSMDYTRFNPKYPDETYQT